MPLYRSYRFVEPQKWLRADVAATCASNYATCESKSLAKELFLLITDLLGSITTRYYRPSCFRRSSKECDEWRG